MNCIAALAADMVEHSACSSILCHAIAAVLLIVGAWVLALAQIVWPANLDPISQGCAHLDFLAKAAGASSLLLALSRALGAVLLLVALATVLLLELREPVTVSVHLWWWWRFDLE